ncbi:glycosyltransferase [Saccharopolyspora sp. K220]|uniref:glycosyltransferase n=1 Tax=Saccharopolyspora soli TaxID=2926618 RepID=UPI001F5A6F34|nr:glycosyltransferase [Saccharopolyspora soli]MCI2416856.1 glycosyltransferase [Saccharopolyspora soli]
MLTAGAEVPALFEEFAHRTGEDPLGGMSLHGEAELFAAARVDLSLPETLEVARAWRPDLLLCDSYDFVGPLVAAALDVPSGMVTLGQAVRADLVDAMAAKVVQRYESLGLATRRPAWFVDICPQILQVPDWQAPAELLPMRPEAYRAPHGSPTKSAPSTPDRPRLLVTFGTAFGTPAALDPVLGELAGLDVDLRVTLGPVATPKDFEIDQDRVTFEEFRPLAELLEGIDLVVSHGGAGTTLGALAAGIPMVLIPQGADQFSVAERAVDTGAALQVLPGDTSASDLRRAVTTGLAEPRFRESATKVADQIAAMPSPTAVAEAIAESLC